MPRTEEPAAAEEFCFPPGSYRPEQPAEPVDWRDLARRCIRKSILRKRRSREFQTPMRPQ